MTNRDDLFTRNMGDYGKVDLSPVEFAQRLKELGVEEDEKGNLDLRYFGSARKLYGDFMKTPGASITFDAFVAKLISLGFVVVDSKEKDGGWDHFMILTTRSAAEKGIK